MTIVRLSDYRLQKCCRIFHKYITNSDNPFMHDGNKHSHLDYWKMRITHHHNDFTSRYHQRKTSPPQNHVLQPTTKTRTLLTTKSHTLTNALSSALSSSTIAPKLSQWISNLSTPLWPTSCLRKAWLNRSGEWPTSPEPVWTASRTALGQTSVTHDEPWPETAKNITQSLDCSQIPWWRALRLFTLDCLTTILLLTISIIVEKVDLIGIGWTVSSRASIKKYCFQLAYP